MKLSQPPLIARWLLKRLGGGPHAEVIAGDLEERFHEGRSAIWFWRQTIMAIVVGAFFGRRTNPLQAWHVNLKGLITLAAIALVALAGGTMFVVGMIWVWLVLGTFLAFVVKAIRGRKPHFPTRFPTRF